MEFGIVDNNDDDDVSVLRPPPVRRTNAPSANCTPDELSSISVPRWPPEGGAFTEKQAARIRQRVLEHVVLHAQPTYRFLGMLEAMSGGALRQRDLVHIERGTLEKKVRQAVQGPLPITPIPQNPQNLANPASGGGGGLSANDVTQVIEKALDLFSSGITSIDDLADDLRERLDSLEAEVTPLSNRLPILEAAIRLLNVEKKEQNDQIAKFLRQIATVRIRMDNLWPPQQNQIDELKNSVDGLETMLQNVVTDSQRGETVDDTLSVLQDGLNKLLERLEVLEARQSPTAGEQSDTSIGMKIDAHIGDAVGDRNRSLRERVTVHLLLTPFVLGLLEVARDEVAEMVTDRMRPLRLCALMHSFEGGVASHFAKYCIQVWKRQGQPPAITPDGHADMLVQSRKTRYNYAAEAGAFEAARDYFGRLQRGPNGTLVPLYHGRMVDPFALPDGVYVQNPSLTATAGLSGYRRFRIERARDAMQRLTGGRFRDSPGAARRAPGWINNGGGAVIRRNRYAGFPSSPLPPAPAFAPVHFAAPTDYETARGGWRGVSVKK